MAFPSKIIGSQTSSNPFTGKEYQNLDELFNGAKKNLPDVLEEVAEIMHKQNIACACVTCTGMTGKSKRYFANLNIMQHTEKVEKTHPLIHMGSCDFPNIVVVKAEALRGFAA